MNEYYDPVAHSAPKSEYIDGLWVGFDHAGCTHINDMPVEAQEWFKRPARDGYEWKCNNGKWPEEVALPPPTPHQLHEQWKAERQFAVDSIVVEIDGLKFDGDELSQARMARAAGLAESPEEKTRWILADNTVAEITADQLRRAARAAGLEQERLWIPAEAVSPSQPQ